MTVAIEDSSAQSSAPLLRPEQAEEMRRDIKHAEAKLQSPHIEDKAEVYRQLSRLRKTYDSQVPRPFGTSDEEGAAVKRANQLLTEIVQDGMCSQAEMRGAPPGAVDKHMAWERRNKAKVIEWKNIMLRTRPGEREAANLEKYRPTGSTLNLENSVVPRAMHFNVENVTGPVVTFSDKEIENLRAVAPDVAESIGSLSNEQRTVVKQLLAGFNP